MRTFSTCFEARDFKDESIVFSAFVEFVVSIIFNNTICINASSLFDSEALHLVWLPYSRSYKAYSSKYRYEPLVIFVERNRYENLHDRPNVASTIAQMFLSGRIRGLDGTVRTLGPSEQYFNIVGPDEIERIRGHTRFGALAQGDQGALGYMDRADIAESIGELDAYLNRRPARLIPYDSPPHDILSTYSEKVHLFANRIQAASPEVSREMFEGLAAIAHTGLDVRGSTSALIASARRFFPTTFEPIVRPICKAVSANMIGSVVRPDTFANYELDHIRDFRREHFGDAADIVGGVRRFNGGTATARTRIDLDAREDAIFLINRFDWDGLHRVVFSAEYQAKLRTFLERRAQDHGRALRDFSDYASARLAELLPFALTVDGARRSFTLTFDANGHRHGFTRWLAAGLDNAPFSSLLKEAMNVDYERRRRTNLRTILENVAPSSVDTIAALAEAP